MFFFPFEHDLYFYLALRTTDFSTGHRDQSYDAYEYSLTIVAFYDNYIYA